jgi:hypothetical protein
LSQPVATQDVTDVERPTQKVGLWQRWHLGALLAHVGLAVLFTWPLVLNFLPGSGTTVPGFMIEDRDQNLWNLWWTRHALLEGHNPFVTNLIWYPTPISLYYHTLAVFNGILATPLMFLFSLTTTYNIIVLFSFVMSGYGAFLLVQYICGNRWAALVGSVVFAYSAYHIATMRSLLQLISVEWVPFFLLFFLMAVFAPAWRTRGDFIRWLWTRALPAGISLFLVSLVDWYYTMYSFMLVGLIAFYLLVRYIWEGTRQQAAPEFRSSVLLPWGRIALCVGLYIVFISPVLIPTIQELRATSYMVPAPNAALTHSADLLAFFQPMRGHRLWGQFFLNRDEWPFGSERYEVYFTYTGLFLAAVALFATRALRPQRSEDATEAPRDIRLPGKWFWAACTLLFFGLALGPVLQVNGKQIDWLFSPLMPYKLIENFPIVNISRSPDRFDMPLTLCLAVLSGYGLNVLMSRWLPRFTQARRGAFLSIGAIALIALELFPFPYPQLTAEVPRWYYELAKEPGDFSILELPPQDDYWHGAYRMYFQTVHGKAIFGGYISRDFPHPFLTSTPGYQELTYSDGSGDLFAPDRDTWLAAFQRYNTRYIVLQKTRAPHRTGGPPVDVSASRAAVHAVLGADVRPYYEDDQLEVYRVPPPTRSEPLMSVGDGWEPREVGPNGSFRWMHDRATLQIDAPQATNAFLSFKAAGLGPPRRLQIYHGDQLVFEGSVSALEALTTTGPLGIPQGVSTLTFVSPDGTISPAELGLGNDSRRLGFAILDVKLEPAQK